jgi:hypothetical protein
MKSFSLLGNLEQELVLFYLARVHESVTSHDMFSILKQIEQRFYTHNNIFNIL